MSTQTKPTRTRRPALPYIAAGLRPLAVPIDELNLDEANSRLHDHYSVAAICGSLAQFGQRRPVVVQRAGMIVRAGNGLLEAARELGWSHLAAIVIDEDDIAATAFAITDNRTAQLAEWDGDMLESLLHQIEIGDPDLQEMLSSLAAETGIIPPETEDEPVAFAPLEEQWNILVTCSGEKQQAALLGELTATGHRCRALIS